MLVVRDEGGPQPRELLDLLVEGQVTAVGGGVVRQEQSVVAVVLVVNELEEVDVHPGLQEVPAGSHDADGQFPRVLVDRGLPHSAPGTPAAEPVHRRGS